jgi:hypothetical protein
VDDGPTSAIGRVAYLLQVYSPTIARPTHPSNASPTAAVDVRA